MIKFLTIAWTIFCIWGFFTGMSEVGQMMNQPMSAAERSGAEIGSAIGLMMWLFLWAIVVLPLGAFAVIFRKNEQKGD